MISYCPLQKGQGNGGLYYERGNISRNTKRLLGQCCFINSLRCPTLISLLVYYETNRSAVSDELSKFAFL
jgi:hypothetical protein